MFKRLTAFIMITLLIPITVFAQEPDTMMVKTAGLTDIEISKDWKLGASITVPPLRVQESIRDNAKVDVVLSSSIGGGLSFMYVKKDPVSGEESRIFSWSPLTILLSGNTTEDFDKVDLAYATTVGFFDDLIMTGIGYNFGSNLYTNDNGDEVEISRWFFLLGLGLSFR